MHMGGNYRKGFSSHGMGFLTPLMWIAAILLFASLFGKYFKFLKPVSDLANNIFKGTNTVLEKIITPITGSDIDSTSQAILEQSQNYLDKATISLVDAKNIADELDGHMSFNTGDFDHVYNTLRGVNLADRVLIYGAFGIRRYSQIPFYGTTTYWPFDKWILEAYSRPQYDMIKGLYAGTPYFKF